MRSRGTAAALATGAAAALAVAPALAHRQDSAPTSRGPNSTKEPYVIPVADGVHTKSLITVDGVNGDGGAASSPSLYEMVGIPDGLGAFRAGGDFKVFANHELGATAGGVRRHGQTGAFVSSWTIDRRTFEVEEGSDLIDPGTQFWNYPAAKYQSEPSPAGDNPRTFGTETPNVPNDDFLAQPAAFGRFCSNTLTELGQLYNRRTGRGYGGRIFFPNEEVGLEGRVFGTLEDGTTKQLPRLGLFNWENTIAAYNETDTTLIMGNEDAADGQVWAYVGSKRKKGDAFDRAGLTNGVNFVTDMEDEAISTDAQFRAQVGKGNPARFDLAEVDWDQVGSAQNAEAKADGLSLNLVEDGAWDPRDEDVYYFLTTEGGKGADVPTGQFGRDGGGLWRMTFDDIERPQDGGTLELLLDGSEAPFLNKPDNMGIDGRGNVLIQEDPGGNVHVARIVAYDPDDGDRGVVAAFDPALFAPTTPGGTTAAMTIDEESSGIIDARETIGRGWWLFDAQVHRPNLAFPDRVEEGQLLALRIDDWDDVYTIDG